MDLDELKRIYGVFEDQQLAPLFGVSKAAVSKWRKVGLPPKIVLAAEQKMRADQTVSRRITATGVEIHGNDGYCLLIDIYNMCEAGAGAVPQWHEPIDQRAIPLSYIKPGVRPVLVRGRSMEPTFKSGAIIGVNEFDKCVISGEAYAVLLPYEGAVVKRLYPLPDGVLIRSDNREFPEVKLRIEDIPDHFVLGRVCWVVQEV